MKVFVCDGGYIRAYNDVQEVNYLYSQAAYCSEGSEQSRYLTILHEAHAPHIGNYVCITDGSRPWGISFDANTLTSEELDAMKKGFNLTNDQVRQFHKSYMERKHKNWGF